MAASHSIDTTTCLTAFEAFKYPLPQVRQFHRSLTTELDEKNARLRSLVGGSYRQLLGTAEMILQMREDIARVEVKLGKVGAGCGRGWISGMASGLGKIQEDGKAGQHEAELEWLARAKVLDMCGTVVGRLLRKKENTDHGSTNEGKDLVLAAKALVLSRLLSKSLSASVHLDERKSLEESRKKVKLLWRRLSRTIERRMEKTDVGTGRQGLLQALSAYSLATSTGAKDVLGHFLRVRGAAIVLALGNETSQEQQIPEALRALELYFHTLLDVQALVPRRLSETLANLKAKPLLGDHAIRGLEGLRLDVCERWFGDEIKFFTPYVRHDDLAGPQAVERLQSWAVEAEKIILQGLGGILDQMKDIKKVVDLRTKLIQMCIREGEKVKGFDPSILLNNLRVTINNSMVRILESRVEKLHLLSTEVEATLGSWPVGAAEEYESPWDDAVLNTDSTNGGAIFKQSVLNRTHGRDHAVSRVLGGYKTWKHLVNELVSTVEHLRKQRWDDGLEDMEDDDSFESICNLLRVEDPQMLQDCLHGSLREAYADLETRMTSLLALYKDGDQIDHMSIYLLRAIREIRVETPQDMLLGDFGLPLVKTLQRTIATRVSTASIELLSKHFKKKRVPGRELWEGTPRLPVQPSPGIYRFLHSLTSSMGDFGGDLWSPAAVRSLKQHVRGEIGHRWGLVLSSARKEGNSKETIANGNTANGNGTVAAEETEATSEVTNDILIQRLFDVFVLQAVLELSEKSDNDELDEFEALLETRSDLNPPMEKRLRQAAKEYWSRTALLFGPL